MIFEDLGEFAQAVGVRAIAGLDLGTKTIGVAVCDPFWTISSPLATVKRKKFTLDAKALEEMIASRQVGGLILGLPLNMDGSEGPRVQSTRAFARNLGTIEAFKGTPIAFWDERLSTVAAERALLEADTSRARRGEVIDHVAAGFILQGAIDRLRYLKDQVK